MLGKDITPLIHADANSRTSWINKQQVALAPVKANVSLWDSSVYCSGKWSLQVLPGTSDLCVHIKKRRFNSLWADGKVILAKESWHILFASIKWIQYHHKLRVLLPSPPLKLTGRVNYQQQHRKDLFTKLSWCLNYFARTMFAAWGTRSRRSAQQWNIPEYLEDLCLEACIITSR